MRFRLLLQLSKLKFSQLIWPDEVAMFVKRRKRTFVVDYIRTKIDLYPYQILTASGESICRLSVYLLWI